MNDKKKKTSPISLGSFREQKKLENCNQYAVWTGTEKDLSRLRFERIISCILLVVSLLTQGFLRITGMQQFVLVLFPYAVEFALTALLSIRSFTLLSNAREMSLVIYNKTADVIHIIGIIIAVLATISIVGVLIYINGHGLEDCAIARITYIVLKLFDILVGVYTFVSMKKYHWDIIAQ